MNLGTIHVSVHTYIYGSIWRYVPFDDSTVLLFISVYIQSSLYLRYARVPAERGRCFSIRADRWVISYMYKHPHMNRISSDSTVFMIVCICMFVYM